MLRRAVAYGLDHDGRAFAGIIYHNDGPTGQVELLPAGL